MKKKPDLNKMLSQIFNNALSGKNNSKVLNNQFYQAFTDDLSNGIKDLRKDEQNKIKKDIKKFDSKLSINLEKELESDNIDLNKQESKLKKDFKKEEDNLKKEIKDKKKKDIQNSNGISLKALITSTTKLDPERIKNSKVKSLKILDIEYDLIKEMLIITLKVKSLSKKGNSYLLKYCFYEISDSDKNKTEKLKIKDKNSNSFAIIDKPHSDHTGVSVSCDCQDYLYTFSCANYIHKCHYENIENNFKRKPEKRNPKILIGLCRHTYSGYLYLKNSGYIL